MICYRDMTFCPFFTECSKGKDCDRKLSEKVWADAEKWWGSKKAPVSKFIEKPDCFVKIDEGVRE